MNVIRSNHFFLTSAGDVNQIMSPLKTFDINHLVYVKKFADGSHINLSNHADWTDYYYQHQFFKVGVFEKGFSHYQSGYILWDAVVNQSIFKEAKDYFNIQHGITIVNKWENCCEFFYLGTTLNLPALNNFYINNIDMLQRFVLYFRDKAEKIINKASKHRIFLPNTISNSTPKQDDIITASIKNDQLRKDFIRDTKINNFYLHNGVQNIRISNRELDCIKAILKGATAQQIGDQLAISKRTAEKHLDQLRHKLNCEKKSGLIKTILDNNPFFSTL